MLPHQPFVRRQASGVENDERFDTIDFHSLLLG